MSPYLTTVRRPLTRTSRIWRERWQWSGSAFTQVGEVEIAHEEAPQLEIAAVPTSVELAPGGASRTIRVTVHNRGSSTPSQPVQLSAHAGVELVLSAAGIPGTMGVRVRQEEYRWSLLVRAPEPGEAVTVDLDISAAEAVQAGAVLVLAVDGHINTSAQRQTFTTQTTIDLHPEP